MTEAAISWSRMAMKARPQWVRNRLTAAMVAMITNPQTSQ